MINYLIWLDHKIFEWIQLNLRASELDVLISLCRDKHFWLPLYVFLVAYVVFNYKINLVKFVLMIVVLISLSDQLTSSLIKKTVRRERPCKEAYFSDQFNTPVGCSGGFSFPSSHASNHMALGAFLYLFFEGKNKFKRRMLLIWPLIVGFAQVYVAVHFPFDVLAGFLIGAILGMLCYLLYFWIEPSIKSEYHKLTLNH
ncbi:MAG: phosphatase PAP2 family protein [Saprospiraceae bacterium]|nr:phosphatase PAP2 family protein [Candidatus Vicinibacter affinis]MBP6173310.1 phosphatase PAP2 family protein [Saprospiraceae bacterium]MBK6571958.1 phosphatase PAP2 family protein [Candidatus Vicinibacter affinis]MBK6824036.1 phosphatase PAP2 family protein [Candidatus Vicinibacter affinis]MBK7305256.1 phosphatase PAP2 family protein [Candidatus Vicinibacter affinis]